MTMFLHPDSHVYKTYKSLKYNIEDNTEAKDICPPPAIVIGKAKRAITIGDVIYSHDVEK